MYYDPMISKLCTWAPTRLAAVDGMGRALEDFHIEGLGQNIPFLNAVMDQERFRSGQLSTNYIKDEFPDGFGGTEPTLRPDRHPHRRRRGHAAGLRRPSALHGGGLSGPVRDEWVVAVGHAKRRVKSVGRTEPLSVELLDEGRTLT
jgi:propionyl-CoA carboxylase alpha chain